MDLLDDDLDHQRARKPSKITRRDYYWAWAVNPVKGGLIIFGPYNDEMEAHEDASPKFSRFGIPSYEVTPLRTKDRRFAKAKLYKLWTDKSSTTLEDIMHRATYKEPVI
jgi:hypothetical protein